MHQTLETLAAESWAFTSKTFPDANAHHSVIKLVEEAIELEEEIRLRELKGNNADLIDEAADVFMCLIDILGKAGVDLVAFKAGLSRKIAKNKTRAWGKNADGTYSHIKVPPLHNPLL